MHKIFLAITALFVLFTPSSACAAESLIVKMDMSLKSDVFYASLADEVIPEPAVPPPPAPPRTVVLNANFSWSMNAHKNDYIEVTVCGSIRGNADIQDLYVQNVCTSGNAGSIVSPFVRCGGSGATWKPFTVIAIYCATGDGVITFTQQFTFQIPTAIGPTYAALRERTVSMRILKSVIESGVTP
jgi:hypothetical protein